MPWVRRRDFAQSVLLELHFNFPNCLKLASACLQQTTVAVAERSGSLENGLSFVQKAKRGALHAIPWA
jgi:hypothetical protein